MKTKSNSNCSDSVKSSETKERPCCSQTNKFRNFFEPKVEKSEEKKEEKKPSVFDLAAEQKNQNSAVLPFTQVQLQSCHQASCENKITPLSNAHYESLLSETTLAISHTIQNGVKETSVRLDGLAFQGSSLYGVEFIIKEFSTAPLMFNIEFRGSETALSTLAPHFATLKAAFPQSEGYAIHRIDASFEDSSPFLFHRKPKAEGGSVL
jgi:hypothetical protein